LLAISFYGSCIGAIGICGQADTSDGISGSVRGLITGNVEQYLLSVDSCLIAEIGV
jgi:hypothetical protein